MKTSWNQQDPFFFTLILNLLHFNPIEKNVDQFRNLQSILSRVISTASLFES